MRYRTEWSRRLLVLGAVAGLVVGLCLQILLRDVVEDRYTLSFIGVFAALVPITFGSIVGALADMQISRADLVRFFKKMQRVPGNDLQAKVDTALASYASAVESAHNRVIALQMKGLDAIEGWSHLGNRFSTAEEAGEAMVTVQRRLSDDFQRMQKDFYDFYDLCYLFDETFRYSLKERGWKKYLPTS